MRWSADIPAGPWTVPTALDAAPTLPGIARWVLPNLAAAVFVVALAHVLVVSEGTRTLFRDSDAGWHIRNGERILDSGAIPRSDSFSYTRAGREWFAWEWLSDVALGAVHRAAGLPGVALAASLAIAGTALAACAFALRLGANFFGVAIGALFLLGTTSIHWLARPHVFSWLLALAFVAVAESAAGFSGSSARRLKPAPLWTLLALAALWANLHGSFLLAPVILATYAVGSLLHRQRLAARRLAGAALLSFLATFLNPYGWRLHQHVLAYLQNDYLMDRISEFRSFSFHHPGAWYVEGFLLIAAAGAVLALRRGEYPRFLLALGLIHAGLYSARHLPTAAVVLLPLALATITAELRDHGRGRWRQFLDYSDRLVAWDRSLTGAAPIAAAVLLAAAGLALLPANKVGFDRETFPVAAADYFQGREAAVRLFARDQWGGYLIYRFEGKLKVFVDGRSDFYGNDFLERYATVADLRPGWDRILDVERVSHVLVRPDQALAQALHQDSRWRVARADAAAVIFERVGG
jgi:hypothetical protein